MTPKAQATATKINKWNHLKLKNFSTVKGQSTNEKQIYGMRENIYLQTIYLIRG